MSIFYKMIFFCHFAKLYISCFGVRGKAVYIMLDSNALLVHACTLLKQTVAIAKYLITTVAC